MVVARSNRGPITNSGSQAAAQEACRSGAARRGLRPRRVRRGRPGRCGRHPVTAGAARARRRSPCAAPQGRRAGRVREPVKAAVDAAARCPGQGAWAGATADRRAPLRGLCRVPHRRPAPPCALIVPQCRRARLLSALLKSTVVGARGEGPVAEGDLCSSKARIVDLLPGEPSVPRIRSSVATGRAVHACPPSGRRQQSFRVLRRLPSARPNGLVRSLSGPEKDDAGPAKP
jgi:hypothetical protein